MPLEPELALRVVFGLDRLEIGVQRCLDVDDQLALVGHAYDHVRANDLAFAGRVHLLLEVAMLDHACKLDESAQCDLTPATADFGAAKCLDQILRFLGQRFLAGLHDLELCPYAAVSF